MSNANPLQLLRSNTANKRPDPTALADGRPAVNTNAVSPGLFFKDSAGNLVKVGPVHVGTTAPNASPASGGATGNSLGEQWLDTTGGVYVLKIWDGSAWRSETGTFVDASGDTMTGALVMDNQQQVRFREVTANGTNYIALQAPASVASDKTITLPDVNGTVVTTGDTGTVTSTMIADATIVDADISASAEIAVSKLADGSARQLLQTDAAGTGVEWTSNVDVPGTLDVTSTATFDSIASHPLGSAGAPTITFTGDTNTGIYSPGADQLALATNGTGRLFIDSSGRIGAGVASPGFPFDLVSQSGESIRIRGTSGTEVSKLLFTSNSAGTDYGWLSSASSYLAFGTAASERMRLTSTGLGVGTSSPGAALDVVGSTFIRGAAGGRKLEIGMNVAAFRIAADTISTGLELSSDFIGGYIDMAVGGTSRMFINSLGRVGIGESAPESILHLKDSSATLKIESSVNTGYSGVELDRAADDTHFAIYAYDSSHATQANNVQFYGYQSGRLDFHTNSSASPRLSIASGGNVGIGSTSPSFTLDVSGTTRATGEARFDNGINLKTSTLNYIYFDDAIAFSKNGTGEAFRIDSSRRLLLGTSTSRAAAYADPAAFQIEGTSYNAAGQSIILNSNDGNAPSLNFGKSRGTSLNSNTVVQSGDRLGVIDFAGADGSSLKRGVVIEAFVDGTPGANDMPGRLVFSTTADGASSPTERMRITSTGQVRLAGAGITFNGDTATANELDDYEEGTFTPTVAGTTTAGTATYSVQNGFYTKTGRVVAFQVYLTWSAGTGTGNLKISGLPFTAASVMYNASAIGYQDSSLAVPASSYAGFLINPSTTEVRFVSTAVGGGNTVFLAYDAAASVIFSGFYTV